MPVSFRTSFVNLGSHGQILALYTLLALSSCAGTPEPPAPISGTELGPRPGQQDDATAQLDALRDQASAADADLNAVLVQVDRAQADLGHREDYWQFFGELSLRFAREESARDRFDALEVMYLDAEYAFDRALQINAASSESILGLAYARRMIGNFDQAWEALAPVLDGSPRERSAALNEEIGRCGLAQVIEAVQAQQPVPSSSVPAEHALEVAIQQGAPAAIALSDLLAWQGRGAEAREVAIVALLANPNSEDAVGRLQNLTTGDAQVVAWERIAAEHPTEPIVQWRLGEALWNLSWLHRQNRNWAGAHDALAQAETSFLAAMGGDAAYTASSQQWLHLIRTAHGWIYWAEGLVDDAANAFLAAIEADPDRLEAEAEAETLRLGIYSVEGHYFEQQRLDKVRVFHRRLFQTYRDNPDWTNNYAFACREVATQLAQDPQRADAAQQVYQESWDAYSRTVELAPNDVRLVNDRALIAVYHLGEELFDLAEQELQRAIEMGTNQLAELPQDVPETERQDLDEAVGDAWENLAYLDVIRRERVDRADDYLIKASQHYPFENRRGVQLIRAEMTRIRDEEDSNQ